MSAQKRKPERSQSSLELLITLAFGLMVIILVVALAFRQVSTSSSSLSVSIAQGTASKLASVATTVGSQGYSSAKQTVSIQVPPNVYNIYVGTQNNLVGHEIIFVVKTNAGLNYVTAYTPINVSGYLEGISQPGTYLINVSEMSSCTSAPGQPCVYLSATSLASATTILPTCYPLTLTTDGTTGSAASATPTSSTGCSAGNYISGASITLTASAGTGYNFNQWTGTYSSGSSSWVYTMHAGAASEEATFSVACYQLTLTTDGSPGSSVFATPANSVGCSSGYFIYGATPTLTASPGAGYVFSSWTGTSASGSNPWATFSMPAGVANEEATFAFSAATGTWFSSWPSSTANALEGSSVQDSGASCVTTSGYIYCITDIVQYAQILSSGVVSTWQQSANSPLDSTTAGASCLVTSSNYIYCMSGTGWGTGGGAVNREVQYAQILGPGVVSAWQFDANALAFASYPLGMSCVTSGGYIYCMGGCFIGCTNVQYASILAGGGTTIWAQITALNYPILAVDNSCVTANGYIYCTGGSNGGTAVTQYTAIPGGGGATGSWTTEGVTDPGGGACVSSNNYIWCLGNGNTYVYYASVPVGGGSTGSWSAEGAQTSVGAAYPSCVTTNNYMYCMSSADSPDNLVEYATT